MKNLIKYCNPEHNLAKDCTTIRLGTTDYYALMEKNEEIRDSTEGINSFEIEYTRQGNVEIYNSVYSGAHYPNILMFCCSYEENESFSYEDKYYICKPKRFGQLLIEAINHRRKDFQSAHTTDVLCTAKPIRYVRSKDFVVNGSFDMTQIMDFVHFSKPLHFSPNKEFRYGIYHVEKPTGRVIDVGRDPVTIDITDLKKEFIKTVSTTPRL